MKSGSREPHRLKGVLRLISSQYSETIRHFDYDPVAVAESHTFLQNRRRKCTESRTPSGFSMFEELVCRHRYACFFFIQGNPSQFYSSHCLTLRKRLAEDYHDVMTIFLVVIGDYADPSTDDAFCQGTGFALLPSTPILLSVLNITQVPAAVVLDSGTGQKMSKDAMLAIEWSDPQSVINAWQRGKSGLDCTQKALAVASLQTDCAIS